MNKQPSISKAHIKKVMPILLFLILFIPVLIHSNFMHIIFAAEISNEPKNSLLKSQFSKKESKNYKALRPIIITHGSKSFKYLVHSKQIEEILHEINLESYLFNPKIKIEPSPETVLSNSHEIKIFDLEIKETIDHIEIPFQTIKKEDSTLIKGKEEIVQKGVKGVKTDIYESYYHKDELVKKDLVSGSITTEPQDKIIRVGTRNHPSVALYQHGPKTITVNGDTITYCGTKNVYATSYDRNCTGCNGTTSTGARLQKGVIAANTKYIPYHTKLYVPGYGSGTVLDTGRLGSDHIDLGYRDFVTDQANWSSKRLTIYILCK